MKFNICLVIGFAFASSASFAFAPADTVARSGVPAMSAPALVERYPAGSIQSVETADQALEQVRNVRAGIEAQFSADERDCYPKFFSTSCIEDAKERRRRALESVRRIEVDANGFKRRARVIERDNALAEREVKNQAEAAKRAQERQQKEGETLQKPGGATQDSKPVENAKRSAAAKRLVQHQAKLKQREEEEAADAQKRAENIAAYNKKVHDADVRQREVAARKAAKQQETAKETARSSASDH